MMAGLAIQYKPQTVGNLVDGLANDFVNENIELVRKFVIFITIK